MKREIKFRAWDKETGMMSKSYAHMSKNGRLYVSWERHDSDLILMQYTGLKDKNGKEIYEGDIVKVKFLYGDEKQEYEADYRVFSNPYSGVTLSMIITIKPEATFSNIRLYANEDIRFRTENDNLVMEICSSWGENRTFSDRWQERHDSQDIEVIGNVYQNPELLKEL